jgi:replicative DNA helicase
MPQSEANLKVSKPTDKKITKDVEGVLVHKPPPHNYEAEQALLGALLHNNASYEKIAEFLQPKHFADATHGKIFDALRQLIERGQVADPITLHEFFEQEKSLEDIGGANYLAQLVGSVVSIINAQDYGRTIYDLYLRRELINLGENIVNNARSYNLEKSARDQIESAEQQLFDLATTGQTERDFQDFGTALTLAIKIAETSYKRDSSIVGVTSGLRDLDKWLGGFHPSDLIIVAGRPSMGKTALGTTFAFNAAKLALKGKEGAHVAFFSLEMSSEQLATRLLAQEVGISSDRIRRGEISANDFPKFVKVSRQLTSLPFYIDDTPALTIGAIRTRARRLQRKHSLGLIIIDYLQLIQSVSGRRHDNRAQELSEITRSLKALAKELNVPIIAMSQLSRAVEQRDDKRPQLADLRESGSIEQDADVVMFIFRQEYYEARKEPEEGTDQHRAWQERMSKIYNLADIMIAKQRHGPIGTIKLFFEGALTRFTNLR